MSEIKDELQDDIFTQSEDPAPTTENYNDDSIVHLENSVTAPRKTTASMCLSKR